MVENLKAPENDRFQVINEHDADNFVYDPTFFGIERRCRLRAAHFGRSAVSTSR
jgi:hypothetical protein